MVTVMDLGEHRATRQNRERARQMLRAQHPALRWVAGNAYWVAHRREDGATTAACGEPGDLVLATPGVPLCIECFPKPPGGDSQ